MTKPAPLDFDDEDPFADSFASFDEPDFDPDLPSEAAPAAASTPPQETQAADPTAEGADAAAGHAPTEAFAPASEPEFLDAAPEAEAPDADAPIVAEPAVTERERPFDWFSAFQASASSPAAFVEAADEVADQEPAPVSEPEAFFADPLQPIVVEAADEEAETVADAPTVPAAFDDAQTEAGSFDLIDPPAEDEPPAFAVEDGAPTAAISNPVAEIVASAEAALGEAMVPRIAIHVFAQKAETAAVAQAAAGDRRLQRASTAVRPGGLPEALALYASSPTPALVIVENTAPAGQLLADLDRLADVCDPGTKVVVIGEANDIGLYRELMRRGVSEYLVPPLNTLQLIRTIGGLYTDPASPFVGRTIAFVGAKGGVGSSTLAHNFAWCLAERIEAQACVVDYDLAFGTAALDFNQDPVQGLHDALAKPDRLDPTLVDRMLARCSERLSLFAAPATLDDDYDIPADAYEEVAAKIRSTAPFMVLDLPHVWSGWMRKTLLEADDVVLVAQPDLASLRNAKNLLELIVKARPNDSAPRLVLNQVGVPGRPEIPLKEFSKALGLEPAMVVPFDAKLFGQAANNGQMIGEVNPKAKAADALMQFAQALTRREAAAAKPRSLVERLLKGG